MKCLLVGGSLDGKVQEVAGAPENIHFKIDNMKETEEYIRSYLITSTSEHPGFTNTKIIYAHKTVLSDLTKAILERIER